MTLFFYLLPGPPQSPSFHSEPSCMLPSFLQPEAFTDHPTHMPLQPLPAPGSILPDRILISLWKVIVVYSYSILGTMVRSPEAHLLKSEALWRWGAQGTFFPSLTSIYHRASSQQKSRESVRWKSGNGSNEHQAASQGEMNESWLPFWKQHNVGTELGGGVRRPQLLLSFATFELGCISQGSWLLRASVSFNSKTKGAFVSVFGADVWVQQITKVEKDRDGKKLECDIGKYDGNCCSS